MASAAKITRMARTGAQVIAHPLMAAFVPAALMCGYWFGAEGALAIFAFALPVVGVTMVNGPARPSRRHDPLTGLPSEKALLTDIAAALTGRGKGAGTGCLMVFALRNESAVATEFGRLVANGLARTVAQRLQQDVRDSDSVACLSDGRLAVFMFGGQTFDATRAVTAAERLHRALARGIDTESAVVVPEISVGVAPVEAIENVTPDSLMAAARLAACEASRAGSDAICLFSQDMEREVITRRLLATDLRTALDEGQIEPWFQPQICSETGRITGFEALARWNHPDRGMIPPGAFLDAVDAAGLMTRLGEVMLSHSLNALRAWDRAGFEIDTVGVNFSDTELRAPRLVDRVRWELDRFDIAPERLCIEVLENVVASSDHDSIARNIDGLSRLGCRIDLDDFGTGHASITNIRNFAVTRLKIDRSFVTGIEHKEEQRRLVCAILTMAEQMGLQTLAEGVETPEARGLLCQLGCGFVQGFGIARPMPFEETIAWVHAHRDALPKVPILLEAPAGSDGA